MKVGAINPIHWTQQKPRQGHMLAQSGAGKHKNKKLEQKHGIKKHKLPAGTIIA